MESVKGFRDVSGIEALKREEIRKIIVATFKNYGFEPAETPVIEYEDFVKSAELGEDAISDIFRLQDKGKRKLALRYEFTFQLKRLARNRKLPYKRYQIGEVFRDEPASANRFRQFVQCDADIIGSGIKDEAEIIALADEILKKLGIKAVISINNRRLLNEILDKSGVENKKEVIKEIDKLDKLPEKDVMEKLKKYNAEKLLGLFKKPEAYFKKCKAYREIAELRKTCSYYNVKVKFQPSLARGLGYYTGNIFEVKTSGMKETLIAGGSYLVNGIPATGISFGLDRISALAKIKIEEKRALIISISQDKAAIRIAGKLRGNNVPVIVMDKITNALEYANSSKIPYVIFLGKKEIAEKKFKLRDMKSGREKMVSEAELVKRLG